jgi:PPOX class probable F420-dependent enzyme
MAKMSPERIREFLAYGTRTGKLATVTADGAPHVVPIWFVLDGDDLVFNTGETSVKGRALRAEPRCAICVDDEEPPFAFVTVQGLATIETDDPTQLIHWATVIGGRYMGQDRAEELGRRNGVPGELLVRVRPTKIIGIDGVSS